MFELNTEYRNTYEGMIITTTISNKEITELNGLEYLNDKTIKEFVPFINGGTAYNIKAQINRPEIPYLTISFITTITDMGITNLVLEEYPKLIEMEFKRFYQTEMDKINTV